jgi:hypothetical protein
MRPTEANLRSALHSPEALKPLLVAIAEWICEERDWELGSEAIDSAAQFGLTKVVKLKTTTKAFNFFTTCMLCFLRQIWRSQHYAKLKELHAELLDKKT